MSKEYYAYAACAVLPLNAHMGVYLGVPSTLCV